MISQGDSGVVIKIVFYRRRSEGLISKWFRGYLRVRGRNLEVVPVVHGTAPVRQ